MNKNLIRLLKDLCLIPGLSGYEDQVRSYIKKELSSDGIPSKSDILGNLIATLEGSRNKPSVMLFTHMDQLGFIVKKIESNGLIRFERLGGVPEKALVSQEVVVIANDGKLYEGIISNKSHHATDLEEKYKVIPYKYLFIDMGFENEQEVDEVGIKIGSPITYAPKAKQMGPNKFSGTAIDDRAGCAVVIETAKKIKNIKDRPTVHIVFSVQEEFNLRGSLPVAQVLKPDIAMQIDLILANDTPDMISQGNVKLGGGPGMSLYSFHGRGTLNGVIPHPNLVNHFDKIANQLSIPLQRTANTGVLTDLSYIQLVNGGVASIDVGFPMRYSHSSLEVCDLRDLDNLINLLESAIVKIDKNFILTRDNL
jgi:putative aminopeptidase FrvX|tara:strand:- start:309 stop:1406 length:1098 start_codon:yes stop_codon:yes gene_type:complete